MSTRIVKAGFMGQIRLKVEEKVTTANTERAYADLEHAIRQRAHYESMCHEWQAKIEEAKARYDYAATELKRWQQIEHEARPKVEEAKRVDREAALKRKAELAAELAALERGLEE